jgi:hypothetical protein
MMFFLHILLFTLFLIVLFWIITRWSFFFIEGTKLEYLYAFFLLKVIAGTTLIAIYTYYYTDASKADIYRYFNDSVVVSKLLCSQPFVWLKIMTGIGINEAETSHYLRQTMYFAHPPHDWVTDNTLIIRIHVLLNYLSFCNIYINTLLLNFLSFIGLVALLKAFAKYFSDNPKVLYFPLFLIPSVVFWSSGPLKEQLLFFFIGMYVLALNNGIAKRRWIDFLLATLSFMAIVYTKPVVAVILGVTSVFLPIVNLYDTKRLIAVALSALLMLAVIVSLDWHYKACETIIEKRNEFTRLGMQENVGSYFDTQIVTGSCKELLVLIPSAIVNSFLRPFIWDGGNLFQLLFSLENMFFLGLTAFLLWRFFQLPRQKNLRLLFTFCIAFALLNYLVIGLTVPIMGAIVHYRVVASPFLLVGVLCLCNTSKILQNKKPR